MKRVFQVKKNSHSRDRTTNPCRRLFECAGVISALLAMLALGACSGESKPSAAPANIEELKSAVAAILKKYDVPGIGIALVTKDKVVWTGGVGKADIAANRDVTADTMFRVGSITKGFVALAALQLVEQHKLDLDEKVADAAPEIPVMNSWEATNAVSLAGFYDFTAPPENPLT